MTGIGKLLSKIGDFFEGIFKAAETTWDKVNPEVKESMEKGSEIVKVINDNVEAAPDFIFEIIQSKFPGLTKEKIAETLGKVSDALNVGQSVNSDDLEIVIANIQILLQNSRAKDGTVWAAISSTAAKLIAVFLAPKGTKWATIETLMEYVYRTFIKK